MNILELLYISDGLIFIYIMVFMVFLTLDYKKSSHKTTTAKVLSREDFCTCRGAQYNNSAADAHQANCYKNEIPPKIWDQSYAGCVSVDDPGKRAYDYEINGVQLPEFSGV